MPGASPLMLAQNAAAARGMDLISFLKQFSDYPMAYPITQNSCRAIVPVLRKPLSSTTTSDSDTWRCPSTHNAIFFRMRGHLAFNAFTSEQTSIPGIGNPTVLDRLAIKSMNCNVKLYNTDRSNENVIDNQQMRLADILPTIGGDPVTMDPPLIVLNGQTLQMDVSLNDTTTSVVGGATEYGIVLEGLLIRIRD